MKAILEFSLPEEQNEFDLANKASKMYSALFDIRNQVFRPARKHGYSHTELQDLSEKEIELISTLEQMFNDVLVGNGLGELDI